MKENKRVRVKCPEWHKGGSTVRIKRNRAYHEYYYISRSRLVMEEYLGRPLEDNEWVYHKNRNPSDDRIENLEIRIVERPVFSHLRV